MNSKTLVTGVIAGVIVFVWGMISWMVLPWHEMTIESFKSDTLVEAALTTNASKSGVYSLPSMERKKEKDHSGPIVFAAINFEPKKNMAVCMAGGLGVQVLGGIVVCWLLSLTGISDFGGKIKFILGLVLFATIVAILPNWHWWGFSTAYTLVGIADLLISWGLAGVIIAKRI